MTGAVLRAVLAGTPYPRTLLTSTLIRLRAGDDPASGWHAAVIKACLSRTLSEEPVCMSLDPDSPSPAYQLGRLFAVIEKAQREALGRLNASVADRYYGAFSATPARVFATLMRGARTHISSAQKLNRGFWIDRRLEQIIGKLPETLPATLRVEDQGRFAVGYYHERAYFPPKADAPPAEAQPADMQPEETPR
jgi:CRISPR-associated protein Csd1